jgi:hypothetical protein
MSPTTRCTRTGLALLGPPVSADVGRPPPAFEGFPQMSKDFGPHAGLRDASELRVGGHLGTP